MKLHLRMVTAAAVVAAVTTAWTQPVDQPINRTRAEIQSDNLIKVHEIGTEIGHPETLQAILMQESNGGLLKHGHQSYGLMQVQVVAARSILSRYPDLRIEYYGSRVLRTISDAEIVQLLLHNDDANIHIAARHFRLYFNLVGQDWDKAVAAYNVGIGAVRKIRHPANFKYVVAIRHKKRTVVQPFNLRRSSRSTLDDQVVD